MIRYFSMYALQHFYLPSPIHSGFINQKVLQRYMPVGGVRIEDDILITSKGYENLTKAPKGDDMFDIIRGRNEPSKKKRPSIAASSPVSREPPLFRAPGCPLRTPPSAMRPIQRAATMPNQILPDQFSESSRCDHALSLRRSMTTDERIQHWRQSIEQHIPYNTGVVVPTTICGSTSSNFKHIFMGDGRSQSPRAQGLPECPDCDILVQTLGRLRQNLIVSKQVSAKQVIEPGTPLVGPVGNCPMLYSADAAAQQPDDKISNKSLRTHERPKDNQRIRTDKTVMFTDPVNGPHHLIDDPEPEQYYRDLGLSASPHANSDLTQQHSTSHASSMHSNCIPRYPILRSQTSLPVRVLKHDHRRSSNHTDDRDWMA